MAEKAVGTESKARPWVMRTYSGHSSARKSNELYRTNLAKGQTGLSIAFDLPTQTGYDPDALQAKGEVGKVGVPVAHLGHMQELLEGIPVADITTSMTINAPAAWMLGLYIANAERQGVDPSVLGGTTQNDIIKEYLSRGTYIFPPEPSRRLIVDTIAYTVKHVPRWNPINVCSYHLQEAGATPVQELAYTMATAIGVLDAVRESGQVDDADFPKVVGRISFFVNAGIRFVEEVCKMRAFTQWWDRICKDRYGVEDPKLRRFRYAVQVNSLGLTEAQPENNVQRIVLEMLGVTLSKDARARSIQLPAWNEALGLPRPWDQQWALRMQQVLAYETDLLEYDDIFNGSHVIEAKTNELLEAAAAELDDVLDRGGAFAAIDELKGRLVQSQAERRRMIETGEVQVVGVNCFEATEPSPLQGAEAILKVDPAVEAELIEDVQRWRAERDNVAVSKAIDELKGRLVQSQAERRRMIETGEVQVVGVNCFEATEPSPLQGAEAILKVDPAVEAELIEDVQRWRAERDNVAVSKALDELRRVAESGENVMPATIALAHAGGTTGEWSGALREVFGEYRAPTGVAAAVGRRGQTMATVLDRVRALPGGPPKLLVAKPGLDGHSNGAEQVAVAARDAGMEVVYQGIRLTPEQIAAAARDEDVDVVGVSILSGSHLELVPELLRLLQQNGVDAPVVVGGIIPEDDRAKLAEVGVAKVYTPRDFDLARIMADIAELVAARRAG